MGIIFILFSHLLQKMRKTHVISTQIIENDYLSPTKSPNDIGLYLNSNLRPDVNKKYPSPNGVRANENDSNLTNKYLRLVKDDTTLAVEQYTQLGSNDDSVNNGYLNPFVNENEVNLNRYPSPGNENIGLKRANIWRHKSRRIWEWKVNLNRYLSLEDDNIGLKGEYLTTNLAGFENGGRLSIGIPKDLATRKRKLACYTNGRNVQWDTSCCKLFIFAEDLFKYWCCYWGQHRPTMQVIY